MHRITGGKLSPPKEGKIVAFLQHGLVCSSSDFVIMGSQQGLGKFFFDISNSMKFLK